jgi:hypothetical protein
MKLNLFALGTKNEELALELPAFFESWSIEIEQAAPIFQIEGERLEKISRDLPLHQAHYAQRALDAKAVVKWLEIQKAQKESRHIKNYNNSPRALGVREQSMYVQGEKDVIELNQLIVEAELRRGQFEEIVDAIKQLGWQIGNVVKLRVAELHDVVI